MSKLPPENFNFDEEHHTLVHKVCEWAFGNGHEGVDEEVRSLLSFTRGVKKVLWAIALGIIGTTLSSIGSIILIIMKLG